MSKKIAFQIRLDPEIHSEIKRISEFELRSLNAQIEYFLKLGIDWYNHNQPRID